MAAPLHSPSSPAILTVGSVAFDSIQTPAGKAEGVLGGSGNYFSVAASFFTPVRVVAVVGQDFPKDHLQWLSGRGIDVSGIEVVDGKTFHWSGSYDGNMNEAKTHATDLNVFEHFDPKLAPAHQDCPYVFLANIDPALQLKVLDQVKKPVLIACDSMNLWINIKLEELKQTLKRVDLLSVNEGEAFMLSGKRNILEAAKIIRGMGPSIIVIKRGEYGAVLITEHGVFLAPAYPGAEVKDPTGAGDSFAGALVGTLAKEGFTRESLKKDPAAAEKLLRKAVLTGCVMASFTVEDFSLGRLKRLEHGELNRRKEAFFKMIDIQGC